MESRKNGKDYQEPQLEIMKLPTAEVFTLTSSGNGDDIINGGNGAKERGNWLNAGARSW